MNKSELEKRQQVQLVQKQLLINHLMAEITFVNRLIEDLTEAMKFVKNLNAINSELALVQFSIRMIDYVERKKSFDETFKKMQEESQAEQTPEVKEITDEKHDQQKIIVKNVIKPTESNNPILKLDTINNQVSNMTIVELPEVEHEEEKVIDDEIGMI